MSEVDFVQEIPADKKYLLELKYSVYLSSVEEKWVSLIVDNKNKKTEFSEKVEGASKERCELLAMILSLTWLYDKFDEKARGYLCVDLYTDSLYGSNIANEWITKWKPTNFEGRPNEDLLHTLAEIIEEYKTNLHVIYLPTCGSEYLQACKEKLA